MRLFSGLDAAKQAHSALKIPSSGLPTWNAMHLRLGGAKPANALDRGHVTREAGEGEAARLRSPLLFVCAALPLA